ncbi:BTAD domain-containing putative transcriptional regulator [Accumulibacter sp.]|uniref:AfsR/SARP family transcriptional regulator n=1 Tax=Accumulibacter sp. TaxID=2053492 RepID=UPI00261FC4A7|nr:BTAD domain-containing putative transcriptional regulator [Accumulibacter sp.]
MANYLARREITPIWYQIERADADAAVFCHALASRAGAAAGSLRSAMLGVGSLNGLPVADLEGLLHRYLADFYCEISGPLTLVVDNAQEALAAEPFRQLLLAAIDELPRGSRLLVASRRPPPAEFSRLVANGGLALLHPDELPFTEDESLAVQRLARPAAQTRSLAEMQALHRITAGWPAALRLLLQLETPNAPARPELAPTEQAPLFDYLASEVFARQPPAARRLLLALAHLPRMRVAILPALCGDSAALPLLEALHQDGNLTTRHGSGADRYYQFHPLLRQFLQHRTKSELTAAELAALRRRAAALLAADDDPDAAAQLLIAGQHWDELQGLVLDQAEALVGRGWQRTLADWLQALPATRCDADPWLGYWQGEAELHFSPPKAQASFERAYRRFRERRLADGAYRAWSACVDLICFEWADFRPLDAWLDEADTLQRDFGAPPPALASRFAASLFGALMFRRPQDPAIHRWADRLLDIIENSADPIERLVLGGNLQIHHTVCVRRKSALDRLKRALEPPAGTALPPVYGALWQAIQSMQLWSEGRGDECAAAALRGSQLARDHGLRMWDFFLGALEVYGWLNDGELPRARLALERLEKVVDPRRRVDVAHFYFLTAMSEHFSGDAAAALIAVDQSLAMADRYAGPHQHVLGRLTRAEALHALGRTGEAWPLLEAVRAYGRATDSPIFAYQVDLAEAVFVLDTGDEARCAAALRRAFTVGLAEDYLTHHYFRPGVMSRLCAFALQHGIVTDFARRLIRCRRLKAPKDETELNAPGLDIECWPWPIRIHTLGRFGLQVDDRPVAGAGQAKPLELLRALIARGGRDVPIVDLIGDLWGKREEDGSVEGNGAGAGQPGKDKSEGGRAAFDINLSRLRRLLGQADALQVTDRCLTLDNAQCWVDLWSCQRLLHHIRQLLDGADAPPVALVVARGRDLLACYRGHFLARERAAWTSETRDDLRERVATTIAGLASRLESAGAVVEASQFYERAIVDIDRRREALYLGLMYCLYRQGKVAEALRVYHRCRVALARYFGVRPSAETEALRALLEYRPPAVAAPDS